MDRPTVLPEVGDPRIELAPRHGPRQTVVMAFGQQSGPPASHQQLNELLELLQAAGHSDFRDARGPMGFTQRQAGGKFTRDEAQAFIDQLEEAEDERLAPVTVVSAVKLSKADQALRDTPTAHLAAELRRRGWTVTEP